MGKLSAKIGISTKALGALQYAAEQSAFTYVEQGLPLVCVNPAGIYGPGDRHVDVPGSDRLHSRSPIA